MIGAGLSLEQSPPFRSTIRFFLTAPLFGLIGGIVLLIAGEEIFSSRWSTLVIGSVHLLTLGFITMVMMGSLMQMLPVLAGVPVPGVAIVSTVVHSLLSAGTLSISSAFILENKILFMLASLFLGGAVLIFFLVMFYTLYFRVKLVNPSILAMRLSLLSLAIFAVPGLLMLLSYGSLEIRFSRFFMLKWHIAFALAGWVGILISGVVMQVVPMFYGTDSYSPLIQKWFSKALFISIVMYSALQYDYFSGTIGEVVGFGFLFLIGFLYIYFSVKTIFLLSKRRRKLPDTTIRFWNFALISLVLAVLFFFSMEIFSFDFLLRSAPLLSGVLFLVGFVLAIVTAMMLKIVPFLIWFHLFSNGISNAPNMKQILPEKNIKYQYYLFAALFSSLIAAVIFPFILTRVAGAVLMIFSGTLFWSLVNSSRVYYRLLKK